MVAIQLAGAALDQRNFPRAFFGFEEIEQPDGMILDFRI